MEDSLVDLADTQLDLFSSEDDLECVSEAPKKKNSLKGIKKVSAKSIKSDLLKDLKLGIYILFIPFILL